MGKEQGYKKMSHVITAVYEHGMFYVCEKAIGSARTCSFKMSKIILERPIEPDQEVKLLEKGRTDLLNKFISKKGRPFSAYLTPFSSTALPLSLPPA